MIKNKNILPYLRNNKIKVKVIKWIMFVPTSNAMLKFEWQTDNTGNINIM